MAKSSSGANARTTPTAATSPLGAGGPPTGPRRATAGQAGGAGGSKQPASRRGRVGGVALGGTGRARPAKPYPEFPLFPHATGRWAKKIRGRFVFFGPWADAQGALNRYLAQRDELHAGRVPRVRSASGADVRTGSASAAGGAPSLRDLVNHFLTAKQRRVVTGEMGPRSFADYHAAASRLIKHYGAHRLADDITPGDFGALRVVLAKTRGPVALGNEIGRIRSIFKYGYEAGLLEKPVRFGPEFSKPGKRTMRQARHARGERMFEAAEIRALLKAAPPQMVAMILLGVNCGMGNTDVAALPRSAVNLAKGTIDFPRPKTGALRRATLWPETVQALKAVSNVRPKTKRHEDADLVFATKYGHRWVRVDEPGERSRGKNKVVVKDSVAMEFGKLIRAVQTHRDGRGFYSLRHTFRTVADELGDRRAIDLIMGHENGQDISTHYVERVADKRLKVVTDHVRRWVFPGGTSRF